MAGGYLIVGDAFHPEIDNSTTWLFRSQPGQFSRFDWTTDTMALPSRPTALSYFLGRLYAFDLNNTYIVNVNGLVVEDTKEGTGCISSESVLVTDIGMFFCDYSNMYMHNGTSATPIGIPILRSSQLDDEGTANYAWQNINHAIDPKVSFNPKSNTVRFHFKDTDGFTGAWCYTVHTKRWDLEEYNTPSAALSGAKSESFMSDGTHLIKLNDIFDKRKKFTWYSRSMDMGAASIDKVFRNIKIKCKDNTKVPLSVVKIYVNDTVISDDAITQDNDEAGLSIFNIKGSARKGKTIQIKITDCETEIDAIGIVYMVKAIK